MWRYGTYLFFYCTKEVSSKSPICSVKIFRERGVGDIHFSLTVSLCVVSSARKRRAQDCPPRNRQGGSQMDYLYCRSVDPDYIFFFIKNCNLLMCKLQQKPSALKWEHPALQKMKFINFFPCLWVIFALLSRYFTLDFLHKKTSKLVKNYRRSCKK